MNRNWKVDISTRVGGDIDAITDRLQELLSESEVLEDPLLTVNPVSGEVAVSTEVAAGKRHLAEWEAMRGFRQALVASGGCDEFVPAVISSCNPVTLAPLRQGRTLGRTLYMATGPEPSKSDVCIGVVDTPEIAALIVAAVNGMSDEQ